VGLYYGYCPATSGVDWRGNLVSRSCLPSPCCSTGDLAWSHCGIRFAMGISCFALVSSHLAVYRCGIRLHCGVLLLRPYLFTPGVVSLRYSASLWRYPASPLSLHIWHGNIAVFDFTVVVSCFSLISSHPAWYRCGIQLRCGGILLRPYLFTPGVVSLRYSASLGGILLRAGLLLVLTGGSRSAGSRR